jgi:hypothetical protein
VLCCLVLFTAWVEFENDMINQDELFEKFFADGRKFDGQALVQHMVSLHTTAACFLCLHLCATPARADCASLLLGGTLQVH